jgi:hypothetical protein
LLDNETLVGRVSSDRVKAAAKRYLKGNAMIDGVLMPVEGTPDK